MDKRFLSTAVIVIVIMASMGAVIMYDESMKGDSESETSINVVARVNTEGSGIYINSQTLKDQGGKTAFFTDDDGAYVVSEKNKSAWEYRIVGTPGASTIQHVQIQQIVESLGMTFTLYQNGVALQENHVYYVIGMSNADTVLNTTIPIDMGILWEPQYSKIIENSRFVELGLTNNFFPGHTCCVIAGNTSYMNTHSDETIRFLSGYIEGVQWVQDVLKNPGSSDYDYFIDLCVKKTGISDIAVIENALSNITYTYADSTDDLNELRKDLSNLSVSLSGLNHTLSDLGFNNKYQFGTEFVDDSYLIQAIYDLEGEGNSYSGPTATIRVAAISGDVHQIALHLAIDKGFFQKYGINVSVSSATNGPGVATALQNGEASFGFVGAPPITTTVINGELVKA